MKDYESTIAELNAIIDNEILSQPHRQHARSAKMRVQLAEQNGGYSTVYVGAITNKRADIAHNRVILDVEEIICTKTSKGTETHEAHMQAQNNVEAAALYIKMHSIGGFVAVDRETGAVVALLGL